MAEIIKNSGGELSGVLSEDTNLEDGLRGSMSENTPLETKIKTMEELNEMIARYQKLVNELRAKNNHSKPDLDFAEETLEKLIKEKESRQELGQ